MFILQGKSDMKTGGVQGYVEDFHVTFNAVRLHSYRNYYRAYAMAPVATKTINPAVATPKAKGTNAFLKGISKKLAISEPTQAPVVGIGIATKTNKPKATAD